MKENVKKDKNILYAFVKSCFTEDNNILYARILQISQELAIEGELKNVKKHITKILIKYTKKRFKRFMSKNVKRHKMTDEGSEIVRSVVLEYVWFYRMSDILKKIFYTFDDFGEFNEKVNQKINKVVLLNSDVIVNELGASIYRYEMYKDEPVYSVIMSKTGEWKLDSRKKEFSEMEYIILILEIFKDIEIGPTLLSRIIEAFMCLYAEQALIKIKSILKLNERIESLRKNVIFSDHLHVIESKIIRKLFDHISTAYLLNCLGFKESLNSIEYYYDLIEGQEIVTSIVDEYIANRYENVAQLEYKKENLNEIISKVNEKLKNENNLEKRTHLIKIFEKIQGLTKTRLYIKDTISVNVKFGEIFRFWIENLSFKNKNSLIGDTFFKRFEKHVNDDESAVISSLSRGINDILTCDFDVLDFYRYVSFKELCNVDHIINNEFMIFDNEKINTKIICCDLLCPISIVLKEFSVDFDSLEENDVLVFLRKAIFKFVGDVFSLFNDKDGFELALRKNLATRLFSRSSSIIEEEEFLSYCIQNGNKTVSSRLETMITDFKERHIYNNCEMVLLRKFQWPEYRTCNLSFKDLDQEKKLFSERLLQNERKKLVWIDSLSSCEAEINGKLVNISLIQYKILTGILETGKIQTYEQFEDNKELFDLHFDELIKKKFITKDNKTFKINAFCTENDFIPKKMIFKEISNDQNLEDDQKFQSAQLDCKIMKICKRTKLIKVKALSAALKVDKTTLSRRLEELKKKGYVDVIDEDVSYIP